MKPVLTAVGVVALFVLGVLAVVLGAVVGKVVLAVTAVNSSRRTVTESVQVPRVGSTGSPT